MTPPPPSPSATAPARPAHRRPLYALLGLLVLCGLWAVATEYAFLGPLGAHGTASALLATADEADDDSAAEGTDFYPEGIFDTDWSKRIAPEDILHVNFLHSACVKYNASVIPWNFGVEGADGGTLINESDPDLLERIRQCPDVDIYLPEGLRSYGYCEDAVAYTKCTFRMWG